MTDEITMFATVPNAEVMSQASLKQLSNIIRSGSQFNEYSQSFNQTNSDTLNLVRHIGQNGETAWREGTTPDGRTIRFATAGKSSVLILPSAGEKPLTAKDLPPDADASLKSAKVKQDFSVVFVTPARTWQSTVVVYSARAAISTFIGVLLSRVIAKVCEGLFKGLTGVALNTVAYEVIASSGRAVRVLSWAAGNSSSAAFVRSGVGALLAFGVIMAWECAMNRNYRHRLAIYNISSLEFDVYTRHLHNIDSTQRQQNETMRLTGIINPGAEVSIAGMPIKVSDTQVSTAVLEFNDDRTFLGGIGSLVEFVPKSTTAPFKSLMVSSHIMRFGNNRLLLKFDEKSTDYSSLYSGYESSAKGILRVTETVGDFMITHRINKLRGAANDEYDSILAIIDKKSSVGAAFIQ